MEERPDDGDERMRGFCFAKEKGRGSDGFSLVLAGCSKSTEAGEDGDDGGGSERELQSRGRRGECRLVCEREKIGAL
jgi:hypothetical protein